MEEVQAAAAALGHELDVTSAGTLQTSLAALKERCANDPIAAEVITLLVTKPMQLARSAHFFFLSLRTLLQRLLLLLLLDLVDPLYSNVIQSISTSTYHGLLYLFIYLSICLYLSIESTMTTIL
jgi:hypothetical protein